MRLAVTGTTGRVGRALADRLAHRHRVVELPRHDFDLEDGDLAGRLAGIDFELLLHPAAMTSLEACEDEPERAWRVNAERPGELAGWCRAAGRRMIHFSTDYVLGGESAGLHGEDEAPRPASVYARSKAEAERRVLGHGGCVVRVAWVFGPERPAFPETVLRRALAGEPLAAVADKTSLPTFTGDLANWIEAVIAAGCPPRIVHACQSGDPVSWHGMAEAVVARLVERGALAEAPEVARQRLDEMAAFRAVRPRHTAMATPTLEALLGRPPRSWREALVEHVDRLLISR